jgi:hypothetical protein
MYNNTMSPKPNRALQAAYDELERVLNRQAALDSQRSRLEQNASRISDQIRKLSAASGRRKTCVVGPRTAEFLRRKTAAGLTEAIRDMFRTTDVALSPRDVRACLAQRNFQLAKYKNIMATIHVVLNRLAKQGILDQGIDSKTGKPRKVFVYSPFNR